jgi:UrcA family protein
MTRLSYLIPAICLGALATPASANSEETVRFAYKDDELTSTAKRQALLERIKLVSARSCDSGSPLVSHRAEEMCEDALEGEILLAIDDAALTELAEASEPRKYRAAQR